jgi:hypothetical protein
MTEILSTKEIAQLYYLDDIIVHEIILESYNTLLTELSTRKIQWGKSDIVYKLCNISLNHELSEYFKITKHTLLDIIQREYRSEIEELYQLSQY